MAKVVICPSCQYQGSIPDEAQPKRIRCPKCKETFDVAAATQPSSGPAKRPATTKRPPAAANAAFNDLDSVEPLPTLGASGTRKGPAPAPRSATGGSGQSPMVYAALGVGGLAVVLMFVVLGVVLTRGGGDAPAKAQPAAVAQNEVPPAAPARVIEPIAAVTADASVVTPSASTGNANAGSTAAAPPSGEQIMERLKDATVYLKHKIAGMTVSSGTGFVIEVRGDTVILATNRHVAVFDADDLPPAFFPKVKSSLKPCFGAARVLKRSKLFQP